MKYLIMILLFTSCSNSSEKINNAKYKVNCSGYEGYASNVSLRPYGYTMTESVTGKLVILSGNCTIKEL